ncbi:hypothetical protein PHMEG_0006319 [Phytophthora megakarya]|uniref:PiggyBac transposable element-derived protein domain-containing protein n=1 Tax=Phytophthora megakarya TaxID=4795 RepID=A0A225WP61_9STRA|nr:hypothetical protein PHMEG_0006319 [Phytophthora megakarya]
MLPADEPSTGSNLIVERKISLTICKVGSIRNRKVGERRATRFYCEQCSDGDKRIYLCDKIRPDHYPNNKYTFDQIWHELWKN